MSMKRPRKSAAALIIAPAAAETEDRLKQIADAITGRQNCRWLVLTLEKYRGAGNSKAILVSCPSTEN